MNEWYLKKTMQNLLHIVAIILYLAFVYFCAPIFLAFFLSSFCIPLLIKIEQKLHLHYYVLIALCSLFISAIFILLFYIVFSFGDQLFIASYHSIRQFSTAIEQIPFISYIITPLQQVLIELMTKAAAILQLFIHYIFDFLLFIIAFYFSLLEGRTNRYWYFMYTPKIFRQRWQQFFHEALQMFGRYFTIELRLMLVTAILLSIGFSLLQFQYPIIKALLLAILDCIPFFGISLVLIPCIIYFLLTNNIAVAISLALLLGMTIVIRQLLDTYYWSTYVKIKTIHTFFISGVSLLLFGIYGVIISPLLLLIIMKVQLHYERR